MENSLLTTNLYGNETRVDKRYVDPAERKTYEIKSLWQRSHEIVNLATLGYKQTEIAEILNIHPQTVSNTLGSSIAKEKVKEIRGDRDEEVKKVHERIRILTNRALDTYMEIFEDESGECNLKDKKAVADTVVLELSGLRVANKVHATSVNATLTVEELERFKSRGVAAIENSGVVLEIEDVPDTETTRDKS